MNNEVYNIPSIITKNMYFKLDDFKIINEDDIEKTINKEVSRYFKQEEDSYRYSLEEKLTKNLKNDFITRELIKFVDSSYLIKLKKGDKLLDEDVSVSSLNNIIRKVIKDRKNDYEIVLNKIIDIIKTNDLNKYEESTEDNEDISLNEELAEAIKEEDKKIDKLTKYINETIRLLYETCYQTFKNEYRKHYNDFLSKHDDEIKEKVKNHIKNVKAKEEKSYINNRRKNIVNLYDYVLNKYAKSINWLDDGKHVILVTSLIPGNNYYTFTSGTICPSIFQLNVNKFKELRRFGSTFTLHVEGE